MRTFRALQVLRRCAEDMRRAADAGVLAGARGSGYWLTWRW
jgi:hypothetical protein